MKRWLIAIPIFLAVIIACGRKEASQADYDYQDVTTAGEAAPAEHARSAEMAEMQVATDEVGGAPVDRPDSPVLGSSRMIIKTAALSVKVEDVDAAYNRAIQLAEASGGYVQSSTISEGDWGRADLTIKVNPRGFLDLITSLEQLGVMQEKSISGQDVTEEYYDLESQLETQLQLRTRLFDHLRKAANIEEIIQVEYELQRVEGTVNQIKGRMKYLETMVGESTINLALYTEERPKVDEFINWHKVGKGFVDAARVLVNILIGILYALIVIVPIGAIVLLIVWLIIRTVKKRKQKKAQK